MIKYFKRFINDPFGFSKLIFAKFFIYPFKYKVGHDYNAEMYWGDRFNKYQLNIKGPGHEGATVKENKLRYQEVTRKFKNVCLSNIDNISSLNVLEIGVGTGLITKTINELGVTHYTGVDITDVLFNNIQKIFPSYNFIKADITLDSLNDKFDLIVIIDVIEHIVTEEKLKFAFSNLDNCLNDNGFIIIAPLTKKKKKNQFYEYHWTKNDLTPIAHYKFLEIIEWTKGFSSLIIAQK